MSVSCSELSNLNRVNHELWIKRWKGFVNSQKLTWFIQVNGLFFKKIFTILEKDGAPLIKNTEHLLTELLLSCSRAFIFHFNEIWLACSKWSTSKTKYYSNGRNHDYATGFIRTNEFVEIPWRAPIKLNRQIGYTNWNSFR